MVELLEAGLLAYERGDFKSAVSILLQITDREPRNWRAKLYLGMSYVFNGDVLLGVSQLRFVKNNCDDPTIKEKAEKALESLTAGSQVKPLMPEMSRRIKPPVPYAFNATTPITAAQSSPPAAPASVNEKKVAALINTMTGERITLMESRTTIGRDKANQIALTNDTFVSQCQVAITRQTSEFFIEDVGAINPTKLNGKALIERTKLTHGDELRIGRTTFRVD